MEISRQSRSADWACHAVDPSPCSIKSRSSEALHRECLFGTNWINLNQLNSSSSSQPKTWLFIRHFSSKWWAATLPPYGSLGLLQVQWKLISAGSVQFLQRRCFHNLIWLWNNRSILGTYCLANIHKSLVRDAKTFTMKRWPTKTRTNDACRISF